MTSFRSGVTITRRNLAVAGVAFLVTACTEQSALVSAGRHLKAVWFGQPDPPLRRDTISKLPYASITAKLGKGPRSLLILAFAERDERHWYSADRAAVITRHGRLVKTVGLPQNLRDTYGQAPDPVNGRLHKLTGPVSYERFIVLDTGERLVVPVRSTFEVVGPARINILDIDFDTILVRESNTAQTLNWRFENLYWVDVGDGFVWKSVQHIVPDLPPVEIEVLKPAS